MSSDSFDKIMDVNVKSAFEFSKLVRPHMNARKGGCIIVLSTTAAYQSTNIVRGRDLSNYVLKY